MTETTTSDPQIDISLVEGLLRLLGKSLRAVTLYTPNHPMQLQAVRELQAGFGPVWDELHSLTLVVQDTGFWWESHLVFREDHSADSISWALFKEGIRSLTFTPGIEGEEIVRFLNVIHVARTLTNDETDDLLTLLWDQRFDHIRYHVIDVSADDAEQIEKPDSSEPAPPPEATRQQVEEEIAEVQKAEGLIDFDATLYFLDDSEIHYLKDKINGEYTQNICVNTLSMLFDILEVQSEADTREETCSILRDLFLHLLESGDFSSVAYTLREARLVLERASDLQPEQRAALYQLGARLSEPDVLVQILHSLDNAEVHPTDDELGQLFEELQPEALVTVLDWIPRLTNERAKGLLLRAVERQASAHPLVMKTALSSLDREILLVGLRCVKQSRLQSARAELKQLLTHEDTAVRVALADALGELATPDALQELQELLGDHAGEVRIAAVRALLVHGGATTRPLLESIVLGKPIRYAHMSEKRAFFESYATLAGEAAVNRLRPLLNGGFFRRRADPETRACVAIALGRIESPAAEAALQKARRDKDPVVRNAVEKALSHSG